MNEQPNTDAPDEDYGTPLDWLIGAVVLILVLLSPAIVIAGWRWLL